MAAFLDETMESFQQQLDHKPMLVLTGAEPPLSPYDRGVLVGAIVASKTLLMTLQSVESILPQEPASEPG